MNTECKEPACGRDVYALGWCRAHWSRHNRGVPVAGPIAERDPGRGCLVPGCSEAHKGKGLCARHNRRRNNYSLSVEGFLTLVVDARCGNPACGSTENLHIDHDHTCCPSQGGSCGKCIRGMLCGRCNVAMAMLKDDASLARGLAEIIENRKGEE